jgi:peptidyl-prolyl cis-trans isomerase C
MLKGILIACVAMLILGVSFPMVERVFSESEVVLAKVGDTVITQKDFEEFLRKNAAMRKNKPYSPEEKKAMLDNLIRSLAVVAEAEKEKMDQTPDFKSKMKIYRIELLTQEYFAKTLTVTVTDAEIDAVLKQYPDVVPKETLQMKEIMVKTEKEANAVYDELKKGADFTKTAVDKSMAATKIAGGNMRPVTRGMLPKPMEEIAFSLKQGEFSKPIKTDKGYYILYLTERKERTPEEVEKLMAQVKEKLKSIEASKKAQELSIKKADELKGKMKVEAYYDRIPN